MTEQTNFEKYLAGQPLTNELANLRRGESAPAAEAPNLPELLAAWGGHRFPQVDDDRDLTKDERAALREGHQIGAVTTLIRLLRKSLRKKIQQATIDSEIDPLGRAPEIAQKWAYISLFRRAAQEVEVLAMAEIEQLDKDERGQ